MEQTQYFKASYDALLATMTQENESILSTRREAEIETSLVRQENAELKRDIQEIGRMR